MFSLMWPELASALLLLSGILLVLWRREAARAAVAGQSARRQVGELEARLDATHAAANARQQTLFNSMVEGVLVLDAGGDVQLANEAFQQFFGLRSDLRGRSLMEAVRLHEIQEVYQRTLVEGQVHGIELTLPGLDGRVLGVNAAQVLDRQNRQQGMILVFHDLTRLKQLENTRRDFVANVSHELRTPLSMIKGYVETLIDGARNDPAVMEKFLRTIARHSDRLTFLIEDLLTLSHLESGQVTLNPRRTGLPGVAARVVEDLAARAAGRDVTLRNEVPADLVAQVDGDRLQQVLVNLVDNAIKYGRANGTVEIGGRRAEDGLVELWVRDDGPGIPAEACERIFERFYRVDKARSREQGGTGLGLAIVKHIVQAHGGRVWAESQPGKGMTFWLTLPADPAVFS